MVDSQAEASKRIAPYGRLSEVEQETDDNRPRRWGRGTKGEGYSDDGTSPPDYERYKKGERLSEGMGRHENSVMIDEVVNKNREKVLVAFGRAIFLLARAEWMAGGVLEEVTVSKGLYGVLCESVGVKVAKGAVIIPTDYEVVSVKCRKR